VRSGKRRPLAQNCASCIASPKSPPYAKYARPRPSSRCRPWSIQSHRKPPCAWLSRWKASHHSSRLPDELPIACAYSHGMSGRASPVCVALGHQRVGPA